MDTYRLQAAWFPYMVGAVTALSTVLATSALSQSADGPPTRKARPKASSTSLPPGYHRPAPPPAVAMPIDIQGSFIGPYRIVPSFDWEMAQRFGNDANSNNIPDLPNTFEYAHNLPRGHCSSAPNICADITPVFDVRFDASVSVLHPRPGMTAPATTRVYGWRIAKLDKSVVVQRSGLSSHVSVQLPEGLYDVTLTVYAAGGVDASGTPTNIVAQRSVTRRVPIEDILIVSIGDSFSSGEGNPERVRGQAGNNEVQWAEDGSGNASSLVNQRHRRAHRSTLSWPAQAALAIEQADRRSSVTFVSVATTGASIDKGILQAGDGAEREPLPSGGLPGQLDEVASIVGRRRIDVLTISTGVNDAGFRSVLSAFILGNEDPDFANSKGATRDYAHKRPHQQRAAVVQAARTGGWTTVLDADLRCGNCIGISGLRDGYRRLANNLQTRFPGQISNVWVVDYPDATGVLKKGTLYWCDKLLDDLFSNSRGVIGDIAGALAPDLEIGGLEQKDLVNNILYPLNATVRASAGELDWDVISTEQEFANGHGYCAAWPNLRPGEAYYYGLGNPFPQQVPTSGNDTSWFRTAHQSTYLQGPLPTEICDDRTGGVLCVRAAMDTLGAMHPNELGHQAVKNRLLSSIVLPVDVSGIGIHDSDNSLAEAREYSAAVSDYIVPNSDVDIFKIDVTRLPEPAKPKPQPLQPAMAVNPHLFVTVSAQGTWRPMLRLYDRNGLLLAERIGSAEAITQLIHPIPTGSDSIYFVGLSTAENGAYDVVSGTGAFGGGGRGFYKLAVRKGTSAFVLNPTP
jgi:hypothetical protein